MRLKALPRNCDIYRLNWKDGPYCQRYRDSDVEPYRSDQRVILDGEFIIKTYRFLTEGG